jgi:hypothetical protein
VYALTFLILGIKVAKMKYRSRSKAEVKDVVKARSEALSGRAKVWI